MLERVDVGDEAAEQVAAAHALPSPPGTSGSSRAKKRDAQAAEQAQRGVVRDEPLERSGSAPRETPKKRTATIATPSERIGGRCAAREIR